jgi:transcriptional regulator with XRE-family HTH domain
MQNADQAPSDDLAIDSNCDDLAIDFNKNTAKQRSEPAVPSPRFDDGERLIGSRLRTLRKARGMSIQDLSRISGLSTGMLSQIERGISTPSIRSLRTVAASLDTPISCFFLPDAAESSQRYIVRQGSRRILRLAEDGVTKALLTPPESGTIEVYEISLEPSGNSGNDSYPHSGVEKAGIVLRGTLRLWLEGDVNVLYVGDSFRFPSRIAHRFDNPSREETTFLWIVAHPRAEFVMRSTTTPLSLNSLPS